MNKPFVFASVVAIVAGVAGSASAAFQYSAARTNDALTANGQSYDRIVFKVLNDGTAATSTDGITYSTTGTKIQAMEFNIESSAPMRWTTTDLPPFPGFPGPGDGIPDIDLIASSEPTMSGSQFSKYNPALFQFFVVNANAPVPSPLSSATYDAVSTYATTLQVNQFAGGALGTAAAPVANVTPFSFLTIVVESGATVRAYGLVGGDVGGPIGIGPEADPRFLMNIVSAVPEPTTLGLLAGVGTLLGRRRR